MSRYAILQDGAVVPCDALTWAQYLAYGDRTVEKTRLGVVEISTVFLGRDHQYGNGPSLWFETLVFGGILDQEMDRYTTLHDAKSGHAAMVARVAAAELNAVQP